MSKLFDRLNFSDNPFASYVAENEPDIRVVAVFRINSLAIFSVIA